ncbi:hypothetical protein [Amycolatopsis australiensis]|nr:hypothetical protein [Amycolatopsis australiensis]
MGTALFMRVAAVIGERAAIRLLDAHIGSAFELERTTVTNSTGPALHADRLRIESSLSMRHAAPARCSRCRCARRGCGNQSAGPQPSAVSLHQAQITVTGGPGTTYQVIKNRAAGAPIVVSA